jgi:hypothetical protein
LIENFGVRTGHRHVVQDDTVRGIATYLKRLALVDWKLAAATIHQPSTNRHVNSPQSRVKIAL